MWAISLMKNPFYRLKLHFPIKVCWINEKTWYSTNISKFGFRGFVPHMFLMCSLNFMSYVWWFWSIPPNTNLNCSWVYGMWSKIKFIPSTPNLGNRKCVLLSMYCDVIIYIQKWHKNMNHFSSSTFKHKQLCPSFHPQTSYLTRPLVKMAYGQMSQ